MNIIEATNYFLEEESTSFTIPPKLAKNYISNVD